ncbi:hypothetical protein LLEC1_01441 [Akanthomyces lecanii]|uniref:Glycosyl transferase CAP10 domain-containing protein n=1 Tax=Cordyceps confragosa TaxID=2714763 RepID=A0A179I8J8_CORDF|nr:hypothetical protein LLEC1_01441 [Akanthomyces lecanii]
MRSFALLRSRRTFSLAICLIFFSTLLYRDYTRKRPWLNTPHLDAYYKGVHAIVHPGESLLDRLGEAQASPTHRYPTPQAYNPYIGRETSRTCYLDAENSTPAPSIYAYDGVPEQMPQPVLGSHELLNIRGDFCFDRFGRYGPYGLGYSQTLGGVGFENETGNSNNEHVWADTGLIDYRRTENIADDHISTETKARTAVLVRSYEGFAWTSMFTLNLRAMITELSLKTGGEYTIHVLMQVKDTKSPVWADSTAREAYLKRHVPLEFQGIVTLWSELQMKLLYPGDYSTYFRNPTGQDVHAVYRSPHLPLQIFAKEHPEYDHFWNWEMDVRILGSYYEMLEWISKWSDSRSRELLWEHNERYYIPGYHKSWENFTNTIRKQKGSQNPALLGPLHARWRKKLSFEEKDTPILPTDCLHQHGTCGAGEDADLITLIPVFDVYHSDWYFAQDVTGYDRALWEDLPRRAAIVTVGRYSRRLLMAMHEEVWRYNHNMFAEMFPASIAFHHGFTAVYAPHPVYLNRAWGPASEIDKHFNRGERRRNGPFSLATEHVHGISSWYYKSKFAEQLWRRWLGYTDSKGKGGFDKESGDNSARRMCLQSMLLHPIKHEHLLE